MMYHMAQLRRPLRKLSSAVFRGIKTEYSFDVYPISTAIRDIPAVFIFSRRLIDKSGKGHHVVSCLGETQSMQTEVKKHKRAKCVKSNEANVVCLLKETARSARIEVIDDIASTRSFSCIRGMFKTTIKSKSNAKAANLKDQAVKRAVSVISTPVAANRLNSGAKPNFTVLKPQKAAAAVKERETSASRKRISGRVGSDSGQRRLSKSKRPVGGRTKTRTVSNSRSRKKLAA